MEAFKVMNLKSRCSTNNTCDINIPISIPIGEESGADLENLVIFHPMAFFPRPWHMRMVEFFFVRMKTRVPLSKRLNGKSCKL